MITFISKMNDLQRQVSGISENNFHTGEIDTAVKAVDQKVDECIKKDGGYAYNFIKNISHAKKHVDDLSEHLKHRVNNVKDCVFHERSRLHEIHKTLQSDREAVVKLVESQLNDARDKIKLQITQEVTALVGQLQKLVIQIKSKLEEIDRWLKQYVTDLETRMKEAEEIVRAVEQKVEKILEEVHKDGKHINDLKAAANMIRQHAYSLWEAGDQAKRNVIAEVKTALGEVVKTNLALRGDLDHVKTALLMGIRQYVKTNLLTTIKGDVDTIKGIGKDDGLGAIRRRIVEEYAKQFGTATLASKVQDWLESILESKTIMDKIGESIGRKGVSLEEIFNGDQGVEGFAATIVSQLRSEMEEATRDVQFDEKGDIEVTLTAVMSVCNKFAKGLDKVIEQKLDTIVGVINILPGLDVGGPRNKDLYLRGAVRMVLQQLVGAARQAGGELYSFTGEDDDNYNLGRNVDKALKVAGELSENLRTATSIDRDAVPAPKSPYDVDTQVNTVLDGKIGKTNSVDALGKVDIEITQFSSYDKFLKQAKLKSDKAQLTGNPGDDEGSFPQAIKKIETQVKEALKTIESLNGEAETQLQTTYRHLDSLCQAITEFAETGHDSAKKNITELKRKIGITLKGEQTSFQKVHYNLNQLREDNLKKAINDAENFSVEADKEKKKTIRKLNAFVTFTIDSVRDNITNDLKSRYVKFIKSQLTKFAEKVEKEIGTLPKDITKDADKGFKGFMGVLEQKLTDSKIQELGENAKLGDLSPKVQKFFTDLPKTLMKRSDIMPPDKLSLLSRTLKTLFTDLTKYNRNFVTNLSALNTLLTEIHPESYANQSNPLLQFLKGGITDMHGELDKAYVSVYDSEIITIYNDITKSITSDGTKCAKIVLTIVPTVYHTLTQLRRELHESDGKWNSYNIYDSKESHHSLHRLFFNDNGYDTGLAGKVEHGELNHKSGFTGQNILTKLNDTTHNLFVTNKQSLKASAIAPTSDDIPFEYTGENGVIPSLYDYLKKYFNVCHYTHIKSPRIPCSVYEMLLWVCGLQFSPVFKPLLDHVNELFMVPIDGDPSKKTLKPIDASPSTISASDICTTIEEICFKSYPVLTTIAGHGDAYTTYACEFSTNSLKFKYPTRGEECFQLLLDILRKLFPPLRFLFGQCSNPASEHGWLKCQYGRDITTVNQPCKAHSTDKANGQSTSKPMCQPNGHPNDQPTCQPRSPLMSYLNDTLPGHLPHQLNSVGCKSVCKSCPGSTPGMPCLTPLGFREFSGSIKTGKDICDILGDLFETNNISAVFCLSPKPPSTLPEHFGFALYLVKGWLHSSQSKKATMNKFTLQASFESSITNTSIKLFENADRFTNALANAYGSDSVRHSECQHPHLMNLTITDFCNSNIKRIECAPYLSSLYSDAYHHLANKHSNTYLSWAVYLPWDFWRNIFCREWGCRRCLHHGACTPGSHGSFETPCHCKSLVTCKGVTPTLYKCGFMFGDAIAINALNTRRTCATFAKHLKSVIQSHYFKTLFEIIDNFMFTIRAPFIWTLLALWSLSLLYLLHIAVVRLDVLRIRSHLRPPSSHRIAAQSLLAAARVKALANVKYFSP
ncbi:hypothetical protein, conserved [Babesia ovata]|uniref:Extracellular matrix-binding ebh n=1 Tax=Babesia ovata TaxID=189622 RepID=A0A2H6KJT4_9APIC|nr:uncharacterized protein BOVATA_047470 [Babesia ovata]GBE63254.1 hypothetical protein, conserved [Babesia ovata]